MRTVGFNSITPEITRVSFRKEGYITLYLEDGRTLSAPIRLFPGIEHLTANQRRRYHIADGNMLMFQDDDEVYHIQDFLGTYETNGYISIAKQPISKTKRPVGDTIKVGNKAYTIKTPNRASGKRDDQHRERLKEKTYGSNLH